MVVERLVGLQVEARRGKEFGGNDLAILAPWGRAGGRTRGRPAADVYATLRSWSAGCFCLTLPLPFRVIKVADACRGLLVFFLFKKLLFLFYRQAVSCERKMTLKHVVL